MMNVRFTHESGKPDYLVPGYFAADGNAAETSATEGTKWRAHPTWQGGKGKGMIGAVNYLSGKGCNACSFIPYNAGGDGDNVWPHVSYNDKLHFDCSKLDQWGIVFDHTTAEGMYLHFKLQETENDDLNNKKDYGEKHARDDGELGVERKAYLREMMARFGHNLALNWNIGAENTQSLEQVRQQARYIRSTDPYGHHVLHTYPSQQEKYYGVPPDPDYPGVAEVVVQNQKSKNPYYIPKMDEVRAQTLWGTLMAGGMGVEYFFGNMLPQNDLRSEDWRSRDKTWDYSRIALEFFRAHVPFWKMENSNALIGNAENSNAGYCLSKPGECYLVYLPEVGNPMLDLGGVNGSFSVHWFNPREGGSLQKGSVEMVEGGGKVGLGNPPTDTDYDWAIILK